MEFQAAEYIAAAAAHERERKKSVQKQNGPFTKIVAHLRGQPTNEQPKTKVHKRLSYISQASPNTQKIRWETRK